MSITFYNARDSNNTVGSNSGAITVIKVRNLYVSKPEKCHTCMSHTSSFVCNIFHVPIIGAAYFNSSSINSSLKTVYDSL